jgi:integrase
MSDGTGRIYRRGDVWWLDYGFRGERYRESSGSHRKGDARALLKKRMEEMGRGQLVGPRAERVTFEDLIQMIEDDYLVNGRKSLPQLNCILGHLRDYFGRRRAIDITTDRVTAYIRARQEEGAAAGTIQKELAALKRSFNLAVRASQLTTRPYIPSVKVDNTRQGFLTMADVEAVAREMGADLGPVVRFAALTGWRKREVLSLRWRQVDVDAGTVRLEPGTTKNKEGRTFPFTALPPLEQLLMEQRARTDDVERREGRIVPFVFHRQGEQIRSMRRAWNAAIKRAGVPSAWIHDLRRTAVRNLERAGVSRSVAMKLTGHKTEAVYRRYAIADSAALAEGVEKLARLHAEEPHERKVLPLNQAGSGTNTAQSGHKRVAQG